MQIAQQYLQRHKNAQEPKRHGKHDAALLGETTTSDQVGCHSNDHESGRDIEGDNVMGQPLRKGRIEDDLKPIFGKEATIDKLVTSRRLHPTVGR